jgi:hypothetical protein
MLCLILSGVYGLRRRDGRRVFRTERGAKNGVYSVIGADMIYLPRAVRFFLLPTQQIISFM